jgi:hypothetical protein
MKRRPLWVPIDRRRRVLSAERLQTVLPLTGGEADDAGNWSNEP